MDPPGQSGWRSGGGLSSGHLKLARQKSAAIGRQARRRSITGQFCFGAAPYTVQRHDCRGIIAAAAAGVHAIGRGMTRAAVVTKMSRRKPGCFCARPPTAGLRHSSAAIAIEATSIAPIARPMRVGDRCRKRDGVTRRAVAAGANTRSGRAATEDANLGHGKIK